MDATLIDAPSSTKNKSGQRDPDMSHAKKGNMWHFGMKLHIGFDAKSGLVHTVKTTTAKRHDAPLTEDLMRPDDIVIFGGKGYASDKRKREMRNLGVVWAIKDKAKRGHALSASQKHRNQRHGAVLAKVEHAFRVLRRQFGFRKTHYRG
jgi:IS5 family transposase